MFQLITRSLVGGVGRRSLHLSGSVRVINEELQKQAKEEEEQKEKVIDDHEENLSKAFLWEFFEGASLDRSGEVRLKYRPGRPWSIEELRVKSNGDLHKLWYVLLKERNVLLTMRGIRELRGMKFPNLERLYKVEESMENLESVVHERNDAVLRLETGDGASPPVRTVTSFMGFTYQKQAQEHYDPAEVTKQKEYEVPFLDDDAYIMQKLWNEKQEMKRRIHEYDKYWRANTTKDDRTFKQPMRTRFDRVEHLPESVVERAEAKSNA